MKFLTLMSALVLAGCGFKVSDSDHDVQVSGQTTHTIRFVIGDCDTYEDLDKREECEIRYENYLNKLGEFLQAKAELEELAGKPEDDEI